MKAVVLLVLALSVSLVSVAQAALNRTFACPDGHKAGDTLYPEGLCQLCTCSKTSYQCSGLVTVIEMKFFDNWRKLNKRAKISMGVFMLAFLFLVIGVFTDGWATVKVSHATTSAFIFNLDGYGYHSRSYTVGLSDYRSETAGDAAYYLFLIAILASVASFLLMDVHIVLLLLENRMDTVYNMLKFTIVSAFLGGIFAIIGIIIFAATFYHGDVVVNYSIFLTAIGAGFLLVGGEEAMKSKTELQLVA